MIPLPDLPRRKADEKALVDSLLRRVVDAVAFNRLVGVTVESLSLPTPRVRVVVKSKGVEGEENQPLHAGVVATALDCVGALAMMAALARTNADASEGQLEQQCSRVAITEMRIKHLLPGVGRSFVATATVTRLHGSIGSASMRLLDEQGEPVAIGSADYTLG